jgi:hypothetical protein
MNLLETLLNASDGGVVKEIANAGPSGGGGVAGLLGGLLGGGGQQKDAGVAGMVEGFLDADQDGAVVDDLLDMAKKFF